MNKKKTQPKTKKSKIEKKRKENIAQDVEETETEMEAEAEDDDGGAYEEHCRVFGDGSVAGMVKNPTFREAFERTGRLVNITCTPFKTKVKGSPPLILNHLTTPHVSILVVHFVRGNGRVNERMDGWMDE